MAPVSSPSAAARVARPDKDAAGGQPAGPASIFGIPFQDVRSLYSVGDVLGEGASGVVRTCVDRRTGERAACKTILKRGLKSARQVWNLRTEVRILLTVGEHPAVVRLHDVVEDEEAVHLIMELCKGGDLMDRIKTVGHFSEQEAARICRLLVSVLQHCNAHGVMHRDFKPENILLVATESNTAIKVADFGHGAFYSPGQRLSTFAGTGYYIAPEVLEHSYGPEADVWSIGVILYILLSGRVPFWGPDKEGMFEAIGRGVFDLDKGRWQHISHGAKDLVRRMLCLDPGCRITPEEIKNHPWIIRNSHLKLQAPSGLPPIRCAPARPTAQEGQKPSGSRSAGGTPTSARQSSSSSPSPTRTLTPSSSPTSVLKAPRSPSLDSQDPARQSASCQDCKKARAGSQPDPSGCH